MRPPRGQNQSRGRPWRLLFHLMEHSDCFFMFNGRTGTLSEFAPAWALGRLYYPHHKPFVLYGKFWQDIIKLLKVKMKLRESDMKVFRVATNKQKGGGGGPPPCGCT